MILTTIQLLIFVAYMGFVILKIGVQSSISETWYQLQDHKLQYLFTIFCWALGGTLILQDYTSPYFVSGGVGLFVIGSATQFKEEGELRLDLLHYGGAVLCILGALLGLLMEYDQWFPSIVFIVGSLFMIIFKVENLIWWVEVLAFACVIGGLSIK